MKRDEKINELVANIFDDIFSPNRVEKFSAKDGKIQIEIELAGVDPRTIRVSRRVDRIRVQWTSRLGEAKQTVYDIKNAGPTTKASYSHGLLTVTYDVFPSEDDGWADVPVC